MKATSAQTVDGMDSDAAQLVIVVPIPKAGFLRMPNKTTLFLDRTLTRLFMLALLCSLPCVPQATFAGPLRVASAGRERQRLTASRRDGTNTARRFNAADTSTHLSDRSS